MKNLIPLVKSLKKSEVSFIQHYYKNDTNKKRLKFFNWILNDKVSTDEEAARKLYGGKGPAYSQLKGRLLNDLMNLLLFEEGNRQSESELFQQEVDVLRKYLQGKILLNRKIQNLGLKYLYEASAISKEYELSLEKVLIEKVISIREGSRFGVEKYNSILIDLESDIENLKQVAFAEKLYFNIALPNTFLKNNEKEYLRVASLTLNKLEKIYQEISSPKIGYYYYLIAINYYSIIKDFINLYNFSKDFLDLVKYNKSINSNARLVNAYMQVYAASMYLNKYKEAFNQANLALKFTSKKGPNELTVIEYQFLALIRFKNDDSLFSYIEQGLNHPIINNSDFSLGKWIFYKATYLFLVKKFSDALVELQKENALLKDKSGWLFGHKLLEIMCFVELEEFDMIDFRIESLRKLLQQQKHKNITRIKTIFNTLNTLVKTGYQFKKTYQEESENFELLESAEDDYYWDPLGYEIIRFDNWFKTKV